MQQQWASLRAGLLEQRLTSRIVPDFRILTQQVATASLELHQVAASAGLQPLSNRLLYDKLAGALTSTDGCINLAIVGNAFSGELFVIFVELLCIQNRFSSHNYCCMQIIWPKASCCCICMYRIESSAVRVGKRVERKCVRLKIK